MFSKVRLYIVVLSFVSFLCFVPVLYFVLYQIDGYVTTSCKTIPSEPKNMIREITLLPENMSEDIGKVPILLYKIQVTITEKFLNPSFDKHIDVGATRFKSSNFFYQVYPL